ncbi:hypothetical protein K0M31_001330, partial [Melipona bicolor]
IHNNPKILEAALNHTRAIPAPKRSFPSFLYKTGDKKSQIYMLQIAKNLPETVSVYQFADNIAIYIKFSFSKRATNSLEKAISENLCDIGLHFIP